MNIDEKIARINELYHKSQKEGLTEEEKKLSPNGKNNYQTALETAKKIKTDMKIVPVKTLQDAIDYLKKNKYDLSFC